MCVIMCYLYVSVRYRVLCVVLFQDRYTAIHIYLLVDVLMIVYMSKRYICVILFNVCVIM